jgi:hypothetical protein
MTLSLAVRHGPPKRTKHTQSVFWFCDSIEALKPLNGRGSQCLMSRLAPSRLAGILAQMESIQMSSLANVVALE